MSDEEKKYLDSLPLKEMIEDVLWEEELKGIFPYGPLKLKEGLDPDKRDTDNEIYKWAEFFTKGRK